MCKTLQTDLSSGTATQDFIWIVTRIENFVTYRTLWTVYSLIKLISRASLKTIHRSEHMCYFGSIKIWLPSCFPDKTQRFFFYQEFIVHGKKLGKIGFRIKTLLFLNFNLIRKLHSYCLKTFSKNFLNSSRINAVLAVIFVALPSIADKPIHKISLILFYS